VGGSGEPKHDKKVRRKIFGLPYVLFFWCWGWGPFFWGMFFTTVLCLMSGLFLFLVEATLGGPPKTKSTDPPVHFPKFQTHPPPIFFKVHFRAFFGKGSSKTP
jgi:hypothetical protein